MHIPTFDPRPGREQPMKKGEQHLRLSRLLEKYNVSMVFSSGIHGFYRQESKGIPYVITGGGGSELASADSFYNYVIVEVKGGKVKDKLIKLASPSLGWYQSIKLKTKLYVKNSFKAKPVMTSIYSIILLLIVFTVMRFIKNMFFQSKRKSKISF